MVRSPQHDDQRLNQIEILPHSLSRMTMVLLSLYNPSMSGGGGGHRSFSMEENTQL